MTPTSPAVPFPKGVLWRAAGLPRWGAASWHQRPGATDSSGWATKAQIISKIKYISSPLLLTELLQTPVYLLSLLHQVGTA